MSDQPPVHEFFDEVPPDGPSGVEPSVPVPAGGLLTRLNPAVQRPAARLDVIGELDIATAPTFQAVLSGLLDAGYRQVEVDLAGVPFCDVSGLRAMLQSRKQLRDAGGDLTVLFPCWALLRIRDTLGLDDTFERPASAR